MKQPKYFIGDVFIGSFANTICQQKVVNAWYIEEPCYTGWSYQVTVYSPSCPEHSLMGIDESTLEGMTLLRRGTNNA